MIRLESLRIRRFRGIREGEINGFSDVNLLVGRNNSGKSTVAEAIAWGTQPVGSVDPVGRNAMDIWSQAHAGATGAELYYRQDKSQSVEVTARINEVKLFRSLSPNGQQKFEPKKDTWQQNDPIFKYVRALTVFRPIDGWNPQIEQKLWPQLLANRGDKALTQMLNDIFKLDAEGFQLLPDRRLLVMFPEYSVPVDVQGDGTRAALRSLMLLAALQSTLFIVEEPESHQHPGSLERFALAICKQAKRQDVQLLVSTHSAECIQSFLTAAEESHLQSEVFHLRREDGALDASRLDGDTVQTLRETGVDVRYLDLYS